MARLAGATLVGHVKEVALERGLAEALRATADRHAFHYTVDGAPA